MGHYVQGSKSRKSGKEGGGVPGQGPAHSQEISEFHLCKLLGLLGPNARFCQNQAHEVETHIRDVKKLAAEESGIEPEHMRLLYKEHQQQHIATAVWGSLPRGPKD